MAKIKLSTSRLNPTKTIDFAKKLKSLGAPVAPATPPIPNMAASVTDLATKITAAETANNAYEEALSELASLKSARDAATDELRDEVDLFAKAAAKESKGDPTMLQAIGFELASSTTTPAQLPGKPQNMVITAGDLDGTVDMSCDPPEFALTYEWQITTVDPTNGPYTTKDQGSPSHTTVNSLTSGQRVWGRVRAIGTKGPGPFSDPATKIVP